MWRLWDGGDNLDARGDGKKRQSGDIGDEELDESGVKCFRCQEIGHHQKKCTNDPICYKCKKPAIWRQNVDKKN